MAHKTKLRLEQMREQVTVDFKFKGTANRSLIHLDVDEGVVLGAANASVKINGNPAAGDFVGLGINKLLVQAAGVVDDDFLRIAGDVIEGRSAAETLADIGVAFGIADTNTLRANANVDDDDFLRIDGANVEGRSASEVVSDLSLVIGTDTQAYDADLDNLSGMQAGASAAAALLTAAEVAFLDQASNANSVASKAAILDGSGHLVLNTKEIKGLADPTTAQSGATKAYVDSVANGLDVKKSVVAASTGAIAGTYSAAAGTITAAGQGALPAQDGQTITLNQRILVKQQASDAHNGIYTLSTLGTPSAAYVLTRATDFDAASLTEISAGAFTFVEKGAALANQGFVMSNSAFTGLNAAGAAGNILWSQFSGAGQITAGNGLDKVGNAMSLDIKANSGIVIDSTEVSMDLSASNIAGTLAVGDGGSGQTSFTDGQIMIGNSSGNTLAKATLTGASGMTVTNGNGSISLAVTRKANAGIVDETGALKIDLSQSAVEGVARFSGATQKHTIVRSGGSLAADANFAISDSSPWIAADFEAATVQNREIYLNGLQLLEGANAGTDNDWYEKSAGVLGFEFSIEDTDVITMVYRKV